MNFDNFSHTNALKVCQSDFDIAPYSLIGDGLAYIASQVASGYCRVYSLTIPRSDLANQETLLGLIECFAKGKCRNAVWTGTGDSLESKIIARRNIKYYKLNFLERIRLIDSDVRIGDENGEELKEEIQALFPELSFSSSADHVQIKLHLPNRH